ncbi:hypothetical protein M8C21_011035 [Ambrosia artemisiifolia]|uniref:Uncharacterized protein n=1 Tax=Ambrosia artemisiifolia TaxID=4212 RepID=A0AAD5CTR4_AMBAR|nr:hypothetical protein M8C21_011035 [Ambrosia artemisiifolia]
MLVTMNAKQETLVTHESYASEKEKIARNRP